MKGLIFDGRGHGADESEFVAQMGVGPVNSGSGYSVIRASSTLKYYHDFRRAVIDVKGLSDRFLLEEDHLDDIYEIFDRIEPQFLNPSDQMLFNKFTAILARITREFCLRRMKPILYDLSMVEISVDFLDYSKHRYYKLLGLIVKSGWKYTGALREVLNQAFKHEDYTVLLNEESDKLLSL